MFLYNSIFWDGWIIVESGVKEDTEKGHRCFDGNVAVSATIGIDRKVCFIGLKDLYSGEKFPELSSIL